MKNRVGIAIIINRCKIRVAEQGKVLTKCYQTDQGNTVSKELICDKLIIYHTFSRPNFFASAEDGNGEMVEVFADFAAAWSSCSWALKEIHFDLAITMS